MGPKLYFGMYFDLPPITQVTAKAQRVLKFKPTDFASGLKETYRWYLRNNEFPKPDFAFEDSLLANAPANGPREDLNSVGPVANLFPADCQSAYLHSKLPGSSPLPLPLKRAISGYGQTKRFPTSTPFL